MISRSPGSPCNSPGSHEASIAISRVIATSLIPGPAAKRANHVFGSGRNRTPGSRPDFGRASIPIHRFREGAIWWIEYPAILAEATTAQDNRYQSDAWDDLIEHWLTHEARTVSDGYPDYGNSRTESVLRLEPLTDLSVGEILDETIGLEPGRWTRGDQMRVSAYLKANGRERYRRRDEGGSTASREWRYRKAAT